MLVPGQCATIQQANVTRKQSASCLLRMTKGEIRQFIFPRIFFVATVQAASSIENVHSARTRLHTRGYKGVCARKKWDQASMKAAIRDAMIEKVAR